MEQPGAKEANLVCFLRGGAGYDGFERGPAHLAAAILLISAKMTYRQLPSRRCAPDHLWHADFSAWVALIKRIGFPAADIGMTTGNSAFGVLASSTDYCTCLLRRKFDFPAAKM